MQQLFKGGAPSRRQALRAGLGGLAALALPGCDALPVGGQLRFWNGFTGPDGRAMLALINRFNDATGRSAVMQRTDWASYYSKLFVAGLGGRAPETFVLQAEQLARFVRAGLVRPVDDLFGDGETQLPTSDFDANVLDAVTFDGRRYGMPLDVHPLGTFYNRDLFARTSFERPPTDRDGFMESLREIKGLGGDVFPYIFQWYRINAFAVLWQWGGGVFSDDYARCTLDAPEAVEAFEWCNELANVQGLAPNPQAAGDAWVGFRQGRVGVTWSGMFMLADLQRADGLNFGATPIAQVGPKPATWAGSHVFCMRPDLEGDELDTALALARYLSDEGVTWAKGGQVPPRKSLRATPEFAALEAQVEFAKMLPYIQFMPQVPLVQEYLTEIDTAIERTLRGASPREALTDASRAVQRAIDRYLSAGWDPTGPVAPSSGGVA